MIPHFNKNGWTIPKRQNTRFTFELRNFLYAEFMIGEETGQKTTVDEVVEKMRTKHTVDFKKLFEAKDYLTLE